MATAEHREPCESRGSCTVLGARGGEIPPRDSTFSTEAAGSAARPTSASPRKLTSGPDEKLVAKCQTETFESAPKGAAALRHSGSSLRLLSSGSSPQGP